MTRYAAYLEVGSEGLCMAHVPDLPGCIVRAASRDEAMCRVPEAIRDYHMRLRRYAEQAYSRHAVLTNPPFGL